jgi:large conductance mechanosensitive channel
MLKEFKAFVMRGNVLDLAVAVIIGGVFGAIVNSLVKDIIMPPIGMALGQVNFSDLFISLDGKSYATLKEASEASAPTINYGLFIQAVINFLIVAFAVFLIVKIANGMQRPAPAAAPTTKDCPQCLTSIPLLAKRCPACTSTL